MLGDCSHGYGPECDPAEDRVEDAGRAGVVERLPEQHGDDRRDHDRQVGERAVDPAARAAPRSSAPRRRAGSGSRRSARARRTTAVFLTAIGSSGSCEHLAEVVEPDPGRRLHEVRVLQRHDHRAHDRVPRERAEDEQHRQQEEQRREAAAAHPGDAACAARGAASPARARGRAARCSRRRRHGIDAAMRPPRSGVRRRPGAMPAPGRRRSSAYLPCADRALRGAVRLRRAAAGCSRSGRSAPPAPPRRASGRRSGSRPPAPGSASG